MEQQILSSKERLISPEDKIVVDNGDNQELKKAKGIT